MTFLSFLFFYKVGKVRQNIKNCLNQNLVIATFLENDSEASLRSKTNFLIVWKWYFSVFCNFWVAKLKPFSPKVRRNVKNYLNQNLVIGSFLQNGFEATLSSKTNVLSVWKGHFSVFCKFLSDEVKTVFWENETEPFKFKVGHKKSFKKWFWSDLEIQGECSEHLEREIFSFLQFLIVEVETIFWKNEAKHKKIV